MNSGFIKYLQGKSKKKRRKKYKSTNLLRERPEKCSQFSTQNLSRAKTGIAYFTLKPTKSRCSERRRSPIINARYRKEIANRIPAGANENKKRRNGLIALIRKRSLELMNSCLTSGTRHRLDNHDLGNYR